jgi:abortive infection bacteriophage resistance protein
MGIKMSPLNYSEIETYISSHRLNSYRTLEPLSPTNEIVGIYYWNKALCASLYPALQCFEITLRNAIHEAASSHFNNGAWYDPLVKKVGDEIGRREGWPLDQYGKRKKLITSESNLRKAKNDLDASRKPVTPSGVVAELPLGFWVTLFTSNYEDFQSNTKLWPGLLRPVFKNAPSKECKRQSLHDKFIKLNKIRNRLSHHEPLWKTSTVATLTDAITVLRTEYENLLNCIEPRGSPHPVLLGPK